MENWLTLASLFGIVAGFALSAYLLAGMLGILD